MFWLLLACRSLDPGGPSELEPERFEAEPIQERDTLFWGDWGCDSPVWVVAEAGSSLWVEAGEEVLLDAGLLDGESATWVLLQGDAELEVQQGQVRFTPSQEGLYELRLLVDSAQDQDKDRVLVQVGGELAPPSAVVADAMDLYIGESVILDSSASTGPEGVTLLTVWTLVDQPVGSEIEVLGQEGVSLEFTPDVPGIFVFRSQVSAGAVTDKATVRVSVAGPVWAPGYVPLESVLLSATGLEGWTPDVVVKWSGTDGELPVEQLPERFGSCVPLIPEGAAQLELKVVFEDPESGEVLARHYPKYGVLDGPWPQKVALLETPSAVQVRSMGTQWVIRSGVETELLLGSLEEGFEVFGPGDWGWGARIFEVANLASGAVVVADRGPVEVFSEPGVSLGEGLDAAFLLDDPAGDWLLVDGKLYDSALQAQGELRRDGGRVRLDEALSVDLDGDGELDLLVIERVGAEQVLRHFPSRPTQLVEVQDADWQSVLFKFGMAAGDLDGDGYPELILSDGQALHRVPGGAEVFLDAQPWVDGGGEELKSPQLEDLDGDGSLDLMIQGEGITVNQVSSGSTWVLYGPITAPISLLSSTATLYAGSPDQRLGEPHWTGTQLIGASWDGLWTPE
jgi:hypothetical protein